MRKIITLVVMRISSMYSEIEIPLDADYEIRTYAAEFLGSRPRLYYPRIDLTT